MRSFCRGLTFVITATSANILDKPISPWVFIILGILISIASDIGWKD